MLASKCESECAEGNVGETEMFCIAVGQIRRMHRHNRGRHSAHAEERGDDRLRQQRAGS